MKSRPYSPFLALRQLCLASVVTITVTPAALQAQTAEIDPVGAIPAGFALAKGWEFNIDGNLDGWAGTNTGAVAVLAGEATATASTADPQFALAANLTTPIPVNRDVVIEMKVKRLAGNTNSVDLFWADIGGAFAATRSVIVPGATLNDGNYHTVRVTFPGQIGVRIDRLRIDPHGTNGATFGIDYVRVYTNGGLSWDVNIAAPGAQGGGPGIWGTTATSFWDGAGDVTWPSSGTDNVAIFGLDVNTVTIDAAGVAANVLSFPTANTTQATGYTLAAGGTLTLNGTSPTLYVNGDTTINASLAGSAGLTKKGHRRLYLGGDNSALSGALNINGFPFDFEAGVVLTSNTAIGGINTVNVLGNATYGGFFGLSGGVTLGTGVTINANSTGGVSPPPGAIRSYGPGTVNTIQGPINVTLTGTRISNNDATRLDITGPITGGTNEVVFRNAVNEGIHLTNTGNSWSGQTTHSGGTLWAEPGTLPATSRLVLTVSDPGLFQTSGTFDRALGTAAGQVTWQNVPGGARATGFSARGGDLTVNLGGAGVDLPFYTFVSRNGTRTGSSATITAIDPTGLVIGMDVAGTGIAAGAKINAIGTNTITLSANATTAGTSALSFSMATNSSINANTLWLNGPQADSKLTFVNPIDLNGFGRTIQVDANVAELSGGLKGAGLLNKTGIGTLVISGPSTWTGGLTLTAGNRGIVRVTHNEGLGPVGAVKDVILSGSNQVTTMLELAGGVTIDADKTIKMSGKAFYATTTASIGSQFSFRNLSGNNTWLGDTIIWETGGSYGIASEAGTLTIGADPSTTTVIQNRIALAGSYVGDTRDLCFFGGGNFVLNSKLANNDVRKISIRHTGSGLLSIPRTDNDFDTEPALWAGTTEITKLAAGGAVSSLGTATSLQLGGTLRYLGAGDTSDRLLKVTQRGATLDSSGTGALNLTSATLTHATGEASTGVAPFALGATTLTAGRTGGVALGQSLTGAALAVGTTVAAIDDATRTITLSAPTIAASTSGFAYSLGFSNANNLNRTLTLTGTNTGDNTLAASLTNPGTVGKLGLTKTGVGKWILTGVTKSYTGPTHVQEGALGIVGNLPVGTLTVDATATLSLSNTNLVGSPALDIPGTLDLAGPVSIALTDATAPGTYTALKYGALTGSGALTTVYRGATVTPGTTSATVTIGTGAGAALTWTGAASGNWDVKTTTNWQDASAAPETFCWLDSVTFDATGSAVQPIVNLTAEMRPSQVTVSEPTLDYTFTGPGFISGTASLTKSGAAKLTVTNDNTYSGGTVIHAGTVEVGMGGTTGAIGTGNVANNGILAFNRSNTYQFDGVISGTGSITKAGIGTTILTADQSYAGTTTITAGTLRIGNRTATGKLGAGAVINDGNLQISRSDNTYVLANDISGIGTVQIGFNGVALPAVEWDSLVTLTGANTFSGGIEIFSGGLMVQNIGVLGTGPKTIRLTNGTNGRPHLVLDGASGNLILPADFSFITSSSQLTHPAIGNLAGDNVINGIITLSGGGGSTAVKVIDGSLTLNGGVSADQASRVLILGGNIGKPGTLNGVIADGVAPLGVTKSEGNTWTFTNANTYTATTTINGGTLLVNGNQSAATGAVTVASGGTLGGTGTLGGAITVNAGGTLAPGGSPGTLTTTNKVTLDGTLAIEINDTAADKLLVGTILDIGGATLNVAAIDAGLTQPVYIIADAGAPIVGSFAATNVPPGYHVVVGYNDGVDSNNIAVVQGAGDPYLLWADANSLAGTSRAPGADPDHDGWNNGIEFVIGSNPNTATTSGTPSAITSGGDLVFTFKRSDESEAFALYVEHSTTMEAPWTAIPVPVGATTGPPVTVVETDPGLDTVTVTIPMGTDPKKFARLRADIPYTP